jgi:hypothetical protein
MINEGLFIVVQKPYGASAVDEVGLLTSPSAYSFKHSSHRNAGH